MNSQDYIANAIKTESRPETLNFGKFALHAILSLGICSSALLDAAKKSIYYGKPIDGEAFDSTAEELAHIATFPGPTSAGRNADQPRRLRCLRQGAGRA